MTEHNCEQHAQLTAEQLALLIDVRDGAWAIADALKNLYGPYAPTSDSPMQKVLLIDEFLMQISPLFASDKSANHDVTDTAFYRILTDQSMTSLERATKIIG